MSKLKQSIAVTIMLAGLILYTVPVQSAPCFLGDPKDLEKCQISGGDVDIGSGSNETCEGYNISESTYNSKQYSSGCYSCSACTNKAGKKMYKCEAVSNATWDNSHGVCCTNGETYDADERQCCPSGGCVHDCPEPKIWSSSLQSCACPGDRVENITTGECCNVGEHADGAICCPENKHNLNGKCICDSDYVTDGTGCRPIRTCTDYDLVSESDCDTSSHKYTFSRYDDKGTRCGTCVGETCTYDYRHASYGDTLTSDLANGCVWNSDCWKKLKSVGDSIKMVGSGTPSVLPIYNRIDNTSKSCVTMKGITKYEKICNGTPKEFCGDKKFISNGCISDKYNEGFEVKGTEWGTCGCDTDAGKYDTEEECKKNNTGKGCDSSNGCYQTCEALGHYSTEDACENGMSLNQVCVKVNSCYERQKNGFTIAIRSGTKTSYQCTRGNGDGRSASVLVTHSLFYEDEDGGWNYPVAINGRTYSEISSEAVSYKAGTYYLCSKVDTNGVSATLDYTKFTEKEINVVERCYNTEGINGCQKALRNNNLDCIKYTFIDGATYVIFHQLKVDSPATCY